MEVVCAEERFEEFRQAKLLDNAEEERDVIDTFVLQGQEWCFHTILNRIRSGTGQENK